jgi:hypothetical protein
MLSRNFPLQICAVALTLFNAFTTVSCSDDDAAPTNAEKPSDNNSLTEDTEAPTISLTGIADGDVVWNVATLNVSASDNRAVDKVEIKLDNTLLETRTQTTFAANIDTQLLPEGAHQITIRALDKAGNEHEVSVNVTVQNILVSLTVPDDYFSYNPNLNLRGFIFLSDTDGTVIVSKEFEEDGEVVELRAPGFDGAEFSLTEVTYFSGYANARTFTRVNRGPWVPTGIADHHFQEYMNSYSGQVSFNVANAAPNTTYGLSLANVEREFSNESTVVVDLYSPSSKVLITRQATRAENGASYPSHYAVYPNNVTGNMTANINLNTVVQPTIEQTIPSDFATGSVRIYGIGNPARPRDMHPISLDYCTNNTLKYNYPGNVFTEYFHTFFYESGDGEYYYNNLRGLPNLDKLDCTTSLTASSNHFTGSVAGDDVDTYVLTLSSDTQGWTIWAAPGDQDITLPEIPFAMSGFLSHNYILHRSTATAVDFSDFDGYENWLAYLRASNHGVEGWDEPGTISHRSYMKYLVWAGGAGRLRADKHR